MSTAEVGMFSGLSDSLAELLVAAVTAAILLCYIGPLLLFVVRQWSLEARERRGAPVGFRLGLQLRRWFNLSRWRKMRYWPTIQAKVRVAYPVSEFAPLTCRIGPSYLGATYTHPFRAEHLYWCEAWFQYEVEGNLYWGNFRFRLSYRTLAEAQKLVTEVLGKEILIHYDPNYPLDALPAQRLMLDLPLAVPIWEP